LDNGDSWGDIIPSGVPSVSEINYGTGGSASTDEQRGYAIWNQTAPYTNTCRAMTAKEFIRVHVESGGDLETAMDELDDMAANEDAALKQALGSTFAAYFDTLTSPTLSSLEAALDSESPQVSTSDATINTTTEAVLRGQVNPNISTLPSGATLTAWFEWGSSASSLGNQTTDISISAGTTLQSISHTVSSGLSAGNTYYFRAVLLYSTGTTDSDVESLYYGSVLPFTMGTAEQTIDFPTVSSKPYGSTFNVSATSKDAVSPFTNTGLTVSFISLDTDVCTVGSSSISSDISTATVTPISVGTCKLRATQAGGSALSKSFKAAPAENQDITISAKSVTISSGVSAADKQFNDSDSASVSCSGVSLSGVEAADSSFVSVDCSSATGTFNTKNVGSGKAVTVSGITLGGGRANRYSLGSVSGVSAAVTARGLTVTAANKSKTDGDPDPTWTVSGVGLQGSDALDNAGTTYTFEGTGSTTYAASTTPPTSVGTYSITPSLAAFSTGSAGNYNINYAAGTYEIVALGSSGTTAPATTAPVAAATTTTTSTSTTVAAATTSTTLSRRITICHRTMAGTFVEITVDRNSLGGHANHGTDIIPAPPGGCGKRVIDRYLATTTTIAGGTDGRTTQANPRRITICHWNASNSYVEITVDANGLNGHGDHPNDIIPAPVGGCGASSIQRVLTSTTTTTVAPGSLQDTKQKLDEERKGGKDKSVLDVVNLNSEPKNGGGGGSSGGGTIELEPKKGGPGVQLLDAKTTDPQVKVVVKSSGSDYNKTDTWVQEGFGSYCWKIESFNGEYSYILPNPPNPPDSRYAGLAYSAVKVKAGSVVESDPAYQANTVFMNPAPGTMVWPDVNKNGILDPGGQGGGTLGDKAISHIILCVGDSDFPEIQTTPTTSSPTTSSTVAGETTSTTSPSGSTTSAPSRSTTSTTVRTATSTTTVRAATSTTIRAVTSTTVARAVTTTTGATGTTLPGATTSTVTDGTSGSLPATPTTIPDEERPPIEIEIVTPEDEDFQKQSVVVELVVSTGGQTEVVFLNVNLQRFSVDVPRQITVLPATGVEAAGRSGVATQALLGLGVLLVGMALLTLGRQRRRA
jgi:hypothetical protein